MYIHISDVPTDPCWRFSGPIVKGVLLPYIYIYLHVITIKAQCLPIITVYIGKFHEINGIITVYIVVNNIHYYPIYSSNNIAKLPCLMAFCWLNSHKLILSRSVPKFEQCASKCQRYSVTRVTVLLMSPEGGMATTKQNM